MTDKEKARELREALRALVEKLDEVHESSEFRAVWAIWTVHGNKYDGPTYEKEFDHARKILRDVRIHDPV